MRIDRPRVVSHAATVRTARIWGHLCGVRLSTEVKMLPTSSGRWRVFAGPDGLPPHTAVLAVPLAKCHHHDATEHRDRYGLVPLRSDVEDAAAAVTLPQGNMRPFTGWLHLACGVAVEATQYPTLVPATLGLLATSARPNLRTECDQSARMFVSALESWYQRLHGQNSNTEEGAVALPPFPVMLQAVRLVFEAALIDRNHQPHMLAPGIDALVPFGKEEVNCGVSATTAGQLKRRITSSSLSGLTKLRGGAQVLEHCDDDAEYLVVRTTCEVRAGAALMFSTGVEKATELLAYALRVRSNDSARSIIAAL